MGVAGATVLSEGSCEEGEGFGWRFGLTDILRR